MTTVSVAQLIIGVTTSPPRFFSCTASSACRRGHGAVGNLGCRYRHVGRRTGELPLRVRHQRGAKPHLMSMSAGRLSLVVGGGIAWWGGKKVAMTAMPQMVAIYNGMGGGAPARSPRWNCSAPRPGITSLW